MHSCRASRNQLKQHWASAGWLQPIAWHVRYVIDKGANVNSQCERRYTQNFWCNGIWGMLHSSTAKSCVYVCWKAIRMVWIECQRVLPKRGKNPVCLEIRNRTLETGVVYSRLPSQFACKRCRQRWCGLQTGRQICERVWRRKRSHGHRILKWKVACAHTGIDAKAVLCSDLSACARFPRDCKGASIRTRFVPPSFREFRLTSECVRAPVWRVKDSSRQIILICQRSQRHRIRGFQNLVLLGQL